MLPLLWLAVQDSDTAAEKGSDSDSGVESKADIGAAIDTNPGDVLEKVDSMWDGFLTLLPQIVIGIIVFAVFWAIAKLARSIIRKSTDGKDSANLGRVLGRVAQWGIIFAGLLIATAVIAPSVQPADLLAGLGVGGVAIGFAFKDILQNFMSGILILLREPFSIGDQIRSGDFEGTVKAIETRATLIKTYDGRKVVIPNSQIYTNPVVVNTAYSHRRSQYDVGIGCNDDLREAARIMLEIMTQCESVAEDPKPDVLVLELADSSVNLRCRWWTKSDQASVMKVKDDVISKIKLALDDASIDMPYPTQVLLLHDQTDEHDGNRRKQREGWPSGENDPESLNEHRRSIAK